MPDSKIQRSPLEPINEASDDVKKIIIDVLKKEKEHLYQNKPRIGDDIVAIVKDAVS